MIAYLYIGLPGSGKTTMALAHHLSMGGILLDDKFTMGELELAIKSKPNYIFITDPNLCIPATFRNFIKYLKILNVNKIQLFYFENDPDKAIANIKYRNDGRLVSESLIRNHYSKLYEIPDNTQILKIWCANNILDQ